MSVMLNSAAKDIRARVQEATDVLYAIQNLARDISNVVNEQITEAVYNGEGSAKSGFYAAKLDGKSQSLVYTVGGAILAANKIRQTLDQLIEQYDTFEVTKVGE